MEGWLETEAARDRVGQLPADHPAAQRMAGGQRGLSGSPRARPGKPGSPPRRSASDAGLPHDLVLALGVGGRVAPFCQSRPGEIIIVRGDTSSRTPRRETIAGRTLTPRTAFWCALSTWALTLAVTATALVYTASVRACRPAASREARRTAWPGSRSSRVSPRSARCSCGSARQSHRMATGRHRPVVCGRRQRGGPARCISLGTLTCGAGLGWTGCSASGSRSSCCCCSPPGTCPRAAGGRWPGQPRAGLAGVGSG